MEPKVIAVAAGKGGVCKTTTAVNLAAIFSEAARVALVDADPQEAASSTWWYGDGSKMAFDLVRDINPTNLRRVRELGDMYDVVIVDTPPQLGSDILRTVADVADFVLIPTLPEDAELVSAIETTTAIPAGTPYRVLLTRVDPRSLREALEAQNILVEAGVPTLGSFTRAYKAHPRARSSFQAITTFKGIRGAEAASDYRRIHAEIVALLDSTAQPVEA